PDHPAPEHPRDFERRKIRSRKARSLHEHPSALRFVEHPRELVDEICEGDGTRRRGHCWRILDGLAGGHHARGRLVSRLGSGSNWSRSSSFANPWPRPAAGRLLRMWDYSAIRGNTRHIVANNRPFIAPRWRRAESTNVSTSCAAKRGPSSRSSSH